MESESICQFGAKDSTVQKCKQDKNHIKEDIYKHNREFWGVGGNGGVVSDSSSVNKESNFIHRIMCD